MIRNVENPIILIQKSNATNYLVKEKDVFDRNKEAYDKKGYKVASPEEVLNLKKIHPHIFDGLSETKAGTKAKRLIQPLDKKLSRQ